MYSVSRGRAATTAYEKAAADERKGLMSDKQGSLNQRARAHQLFVRTPHPDRPLIGIRGQKQYVLPEWHSRDCNF
jgi:hypothetical protein